LGSGVGVGEVSVCKQPALQIIIVTFLTVIKIETKAVGQEVVIRAIGEVVGQSVQVPYEIVLLLLLLLVIEQK
jgi:hypothetical protein